MENRNEISWKWITRLLITPVITFILIIVLLAGPVPMMMATVDKVNADTTSGSISRLLNLGYQVWAAPGTTVSTDLLPSTNNTYTNGSQALQWANGWYNNFNVTGKANVASLNATAASSTTIVTNLNADLLDGQTGSYYDPRLNTTGRGATYVLAASDAPAAIKNQADAVATGNVTDALQAAMATAETGYGYVRFIGAFTYDTDITFSPVSLKAQVVLDFSSSNLTYTGSGVALTINTNEIPAGAGWPDKSVYINNLNLNGTSAATGGVLRSNCIRVTLDNPIINGFSAGYGLKDVTTSGYSNEQNTVIGGNMSNDLYPWLIDNGGFSRMDETTQIGTTRLGAVANGTGFKVAAGSLSLRNFNAQSIYVLLQGNNSTGFDFGSDQWIGSTIQTAVVENPSGYTSTTGFTSTAYSNPVLLNPSFVNTVTTSWGGTARSWASSYAYPYSQVFQNIPSLYKSKLLYTFQESAGVGLNDLSGNYVPGTLFNNPVWSTSGQLGVATFTSASSQWAKTSSNITLSGNFTMVLAVRPDFNGNDSTAHYFSYWYPGTATDYMHFLKGADNNIAFVVGNGSQVVASANTTFVSGTQYIFVLTFNATSGNATIYQNGVQFATAVNAAVSMTSTSAVLGIGSTDIGGSIAGGDYSLFAILPRVMAPSEALALSHTLLDMSGAGY